MANPVGRPKEYDRPAVGRQFVQWVKDHPDCLTVPHFTTANGYATHRLIEWAKEDPEFREYYLEAKELIGINRLKATDNQDGFKLDKTIYLRHVGNFDSDKRNFDREEKAYEASLKTPETTTPQKVVFEVNYSNDKVALSPSQLPATDTPSA